MDRDADQASGTDLTGSPAVLPAAGSGGCGVALLGPLRVDPALGAADLGSPKQRELLAVLALHAGTVVSHDVLADALWQGVPPRTSAHSLQLYVSTLRRILSAAGSRVSIETHQRGYRLAVARDDVDLFRFRRLVEEGVAEVAREHWPEAARTLDEAMNLWRGPALVEFTSREFAAPHIASADALRLDGLEGRAAAALALGDSATAMRTAAEVMAADALRERACGVLMLAMYRAGRTAEALRTYEEMRELLGEELGALPSPELRSLHERILRHDQDLLVHAAPRQPTGTPDRTTAGSAPVGSLPAPTRRRPRLASALTLVAVVAAVVAATMTGLALGDKADEAPGTVFLLYHGDGEVNLLVEAGFDRAVTDFGLVGKELTTGDQNAATTIDEQATAGALLLDFTVDTDMAAVARRHEDATFVAVDDPGRDDAPNLATIRFSTHEAAYLAGFAAARTTTTGKVGFVGGVDYATIWPFEAGFVAGARAADPGVDVLVRYLSEPPGFGEGFLNPRAGERTARQLFDRGADVVFAAAGSSGLGVFEAATNDSRPGRKLWAIGVDSDQYETVATLPGTVDVEGWRRHILTSVVLRFDRAVYAAIADYARGDFRAGLHRYDLANGGVELSFSGGYLQGLQGELDELRRAVAGGELTVPCRPARVPNGDTEEC